MVAPLHLRNVYSDMSLDDGRLGLHRIVEATNSWSNYGQLRRSTDRCY